MSRPIACDVVVHGRVQGVFFRDRTQREAYRLGVAGWVRNCEDGTVQARLEGPPDAVAELVRWCRHGPRHAHVVDLRVTEIEPEGLEGFSVR